MEDYVAWEVELKEISIKEWRMFHTLTSLGGPVGRIDFKTVLGFSFVRRGAELEVFIQRLGELCDELRTTAENRQVLTAETETFGPFHEVVGDVIESMDETSDREARMLAGLVVVLDLAREGRAEKDHHIFVMDLHD